MDAARLEKLELLMEQALALMAGPNGLLAGSLCIATSGRSSPTVAYGVSMSASTGWPSTMKRSWRRWRMRWKMGRLWVRLPVYRIALAPLVVKSRART